MASVDNQALIMVTPKSTFTESKKNKRGLNAANSTKFFDTEPHGYGIAWDDLKYRIIKIHVPR